MNTPGSAYNNSFELSGSSVHSSVTISEISLISVFNGIPNADIYGLLHSLKGSQSVQSKLARTQALEPSIVD